VGLLASNIPKRCRLIDVMLFLGGGIGFRNVEDSEWVGSNGEGKNDFVKIVGCLFLQNYFWTITA
jgi:hypothetical protein